MEDFIQIESSNISLGKCFSENVYFDDKKNIFILAGKPIRRFHLDAIKQWDLKVLYTKGKMISQKEAELLFANKNKSSAVDEVEECEEVDEVEDCEEVEECEEV